MARYSKSAIVWEDGIIEWFDGPEWDDVALQSFILAETQLEEAAKKNAIWQDRTGDARDGLTAQAWKDPRGSVMIALFHTVDYGVWLETIQNGRFAVIMRTLESEGARLIDNAIRRIKYARKGRMV